MKRLQSFACLFTRLLIAELFENYKRVSYGNLDRVINDQDRILTIKTASHEDGMSDIYNDNSEHVMK
jgi:hypothetical protein